MGSIHQDMRAQYTAHLYGPGDKIALPSGQIATIVACMLDAGRLCYRLRYDDGQMVELLEKFILRHGEPA